MTHASSTTLPTDAARDTFDLVVIGAGMAGLAAARKVASKGRRVAIVDSRPYGGTCALRGCDPKKVLIGLADLVDAQERLRDHGLRGASAIDWAQAMAFKRTFTEPLPAKLEAGLVRAGVTPLHGEASFVAPDRLRVGRDTIRSEAFLIATGATPRPLSLPGAEHLATSSDFLELDALPNRIVFVGGGFVSFEFAHLAARAGAHVTVVDRHARPLTAFDPDLVDRLVDESRARGIDVRSERSVTAVDARRNGCTVHLDDGATIDADLVVHGAGRVPDLEGLDLDAAEVPFDPARGVQVNDRLQSVGNPAVYAAGDAAATDGPPLTPVAVHEGLIAAANLLGGEPRRPDYRGTPSVVFTGPPLARAGLGEEEARAAGMDLDVRSGDMSRWFTARRTREPVAAYKVLIDRQSDRIVGAHLLAGHAAETIDLFALAIRHGLTRRDLKTSVLVHPAAASDVVYMI
ncbi:MAG: NAD(P)/FAD-dependent oxidoreductase [Trueperaceae bacterium]